MFCRFRGCESALRCEDFLRIELAEHLVVDCIWIVKAAKKEKVRYRLTNVDDVHSLMPGIHVMCNRVTDQGDFGEKTDNDTGSEDESDESREDQELPIAVWALIRARCQYQRRRTQKRRWAH